ncbi:uncharacterized protein LOC124915683 [Impatiens glandulifera]|uniref:uncharacterized protein LOC124915683 n=1 Tax=Impatiens glandulifera TaxID=253017 RepID=UPI001FB0AD23|nr:uncharacterized protein LOC124915683 [Impatiens glandulifera]
MGMVGSGCYAAMDSLSETADIDIETGVGVGGCISEEEDEEGEEEQRAVYSKTCCRSLVRTDGSTETTMNSSSNVLVLDDVKLFETRTKVVKEKKSSKKPPRPPRSSKPLSLDAADQKLIKEISQLIILKRARVERIKALKAKSAKAASSSANGNLFAMICTILFCVVFIFQGVSSGRRIDTKTVFQSSRVSPEIVGYELPIPPLNYDSMKPKVEEDADATS